MSPLSNGFLAAEPIGGISFPPGIVQAILVSERSLLTASVFCAGCSPLATTLFWFAMRPAFHLFLLYNPGYGFAFGSFKSLFVVIIWIHFSFIVLLAGAEITENLGGMKRPSSGN